MPGQLQACECSFRSFCDGRQTALPVKSCCRCKRNELIEKSLEATEHDQKLFVSGCRGDFFGRLCTFKEKMPNTFERKIVKTTIMLIVVAAVLFLIAGCGPGEPFEIESLRAPQSATPTHVVAAR